jgi:hypothetical protein
MLASTLLAGAMIIGAVPRLCFAQDAAAARELLTVHVANASESPKAGVVSFGFPLPETARIADPAALSVRGPSGERIPCQFRALSRWRAPREDSSAPLKWALATVLADVPGRSRADYRVVAEAARPESFAARLEIAAGPDAIEVRTAPDARFSVPVAAFGPFSAVTAGGTSPVTSAGSLKMADPEGQDVRAAVTEATRVEESGPLRAVLLQRGTLEKLRYTCRWHFHAGSRDVVLDFRLENPAAYGVFQKSIEPGTRYFASLEIVQPVAGEGLAATSPANAAPLSGAARFAIDQTFGAPRPNDVLAGFSFTESLDGSKLLAGRRHAGALDVSGGAGGVTVFVPRFFENHPKALAAEGGAIRVGLFPAFGHGPEYRGPRTSPFDQKHEIDPLARDHYRFEGGRWKTHRIVFAFHDGTRRPGEIAEVAKQLDTPLVGWPDPYAVRASRALGSLWVERGVLAGDPSVDRFERFLDIMASDAAADAVGQLGRIGLQAFLDRGGTYGKHHTYGWDNFGDIPWGDGWCNLHYDWPAAMLSGFLRTGDVRLFTRGCAMAEFRRDYGQNHSQDEREPWRGAAFYEKGWWHGDGMPGNASHNWLLGLLLHHAITGDEGTREAAVENAAYALRSAPGGWTGWWGSRIPGWAIDCLVDAWSFLGDPRYLAEARAGIARYEELELEDGGSGWHLNPANRATTVWMENILFLGAAKYVDASGDPGPLPLLARMRNWFKRSCIVPPEGPPMAVTVPSVLEQWAPPQGGVGRTSVHHVWSMAACLSWSACLFDDPDDRAWATILFDSAVRWWQESPGGKPRNPLSASSWSPITMRPLAFPNSESKVLANVLNYGAPHLGMRALEEARR